jgi:hypothetical protein
MLLGSKVAVCLKRAVLRLPVFSKAVKQAPAHGCTSRRPALSKSSGNAIEPERIELADRRRAARSLQEGFIAMGEAFFVTREEGFMGD